MAAARSPRRRPTRRPGPTPPRRPAWPGSRRPGALPVPEVLAVADDPAQDPRLLVLAWVQERPAGPGFAEALGHGLAAVHDAGAPAHGALPPRTDGAVLRLGPLALPSAPAGTGPPATPSSASRRCCARRRTAARCRTAARPASRPSWPGCRRSPARRSRRRACTATCGAATCSPRGTGRARCSSTRPPTAGTARSTWPCSRSSARRAAWSASSPPTRRCTRSPTGTLERVALWQLFPLLVHAVLFGGGYGAAVDRAARAYA